MCRDVTLDAFEPEHRLERQAFERARAYMRNAAASLDLVAQYTSNFSEHTDQQAAITEHNAEHDTEHTVDHNTDQTTERAIEQTIEHPAIEPTQAILLHRMTAAPAAIGVLLQRLRAAGIINMSQDGFVNVLPRLRGPGANAVIAGNDVAPPASSESVIGSVTHSELVSEEGNEESTGAAETDGNLEDGNGEGRSEDE